MFRKTNEDERKREHGDTALSVDSIDICRNLDKSKFVSERVLGESFDEQLRNRYKHVLCPSTQKTLDEY